MASQTSKYEYLVLMDFSKASYMALKYAVALTKKIGGRINIFHVIKLDAGDYEISIFNSIQSEKPYIENRLRRIVEILFEDGIHANYQYSLGLTNEEIAKHLSCSNYDIVFVGKRKNKLYPIGSTTKFLIREYSGSLLVVDEFTNDLTSNSKVALGCNHNTIGKYNLEILLGIYKYSANPLILLNVRSQKGRNREVKLPKSWLATSHKVDRIQLDYIKNTSIVCGIIDFICNENIDFFCMGRGKMNDSLFSQIFNQGPIVSQLSNAINIPLLILGDYNNQKSKTENLN